MTEPSNRPSSRRDRARADTVHDIKLTARNLLVERGIEGLALRAVARELGMTAPALYRYFASRENLVEHVVADLYDELRGHLEVVRDSVRPATPGARLAAVSRAFREWAVTHPAEFGLLFGSAQEMVIDPADSHGEGQHPPQVASRRFGAVFADVVSQLYLETRFPVPAEEELDPALRAQLAQWSATLPASLPLGVMYVFLSSWIRLYGIVCMEVFGHLRFALTDAAPMFEAELRALGERLGVTEEDRPSG